MSAFGPQSQQSRGIEVHARVEIFLLEAECDHRRVDELLALDARDNAQDGVIKGGGNGHG